MLQFHKKIEQFKGWEYTDQIIKDTSDLKFQIVHHKKNTLSNLTKKQDDEDFNITIKSLKLHLMEGFDEVIKKSADKYENAFDAFK